MTAPLVSVIIPCYRAEATLARALRSLLAQTQSDWEALIVSDDGHDYRPLVATAGIQDPRLRFVSSGGIGSGAPAARNAGLAAARGRLIAPLDADDLFLPERLARLTPLALSAGAAFDNLRVVEEESGEVLSQLFERSEDFLLDAAGFFRTSVPLMPLARRELLRGWDPGIELCDDVALNLTLFDRIPRIPVTAEALHEYRVREGSICHSSDSGARAERGYNALLARLERDGYGLSDPQLVELARRAIGAKRALNRAFMAAQAEEPALTFQSFVIRSGMAAGS